MAPSSIVLRWLGVVLAAAVFLVGSTPLAAKTKVTKRYYFALHEVKVGDDVIADLGMVTDAVSAKTKAAFDANEKIVTTVEGAPDTAGTEAAWKKFLAAKKLAAAYRINVEIDEASEDVSDDPRKADKGGQILTIKIHLRLFGETIPARKLGFTGEGGATIKQEIGKKVRDADRKYGWESAAEQALSAALAQAIAKVEAPKAKP